MRPIYLKKILSFLFLSYLCLVAMVISAEVIDKIVAIVNDKIITQSEVDKALAPLLAQYETVYAEKEFSQKLAEAKKDIIDRLIENELILAEAKRQGIEVDDQDIEIRIEEIRAKFISREEFEVTLQDQGLTLTDLENNYRTQIMIQRVINREVKSRVVVKPTEIATYYYARLDEFTHPEEIKVSHILIRIENGSEGGQVHRRAKEVLALLDEGADFAQVAREHSRGPRANWGGDIGFVSRGQMIEEMDKAIFKLEIGKHSRLIKSDLGYHIVKVEEKRTPYLKDLTLVQSEIEVLLLQQKTEEEFTQWINKLRKDAFISIKKD